MVSNMKKNAIILLFLIINLFFLNDKAKAFGLFYTNAVYPITATGSVTPEDKKSLKKGGASALNILYLFEVGDAGINKAAQSANINKIHYIDIREKTIFIFYRKLTTTVYGE